jgi:hypothetical protein
VGGWVGGWSIHIEDSKKSPGGLFLTLLRICVYGELVKKRLVDNIHFQEKDVEIVFIKTNLRMGNTMVIGKKVGMSLFVIMMVMCFDILRCHSQEKPPDKIIKNFIISIDIIGDRNDEDTNFRNYKINKFNITQNLFSNKNNRYYIIVDYDISYEELTPKGGWHAKNKKQSNRRFSLEWKHNTWYVYDN